MVCQETVFPEITFQEIVSTRYDQLTVQAFLNAYFPFADVDWSALYANQAISVNGRPAPESQRLNQGDRVSVSFIDYREPEVATHWKILWQNDDIAAVHKPATLPMSRTTRNIFNNLTACLQRDSGFEDPHPLHRLDKETAGIVLVGKTAQAAAKWQPLLKSLMVSKIYHAQVQGKPNWQQLTCEAKLNTLPNSAIRCQMHVVDDNDKGKQCETRFKLLETNGSISTIECELITGRKHQIRAHLASLGHPIIGDKIYANQGQYYLNRLNDCLTQQDIDSLGAPHHLLFAHRVTLAIDEQRIDIVDPHFPPAWVTFQ